MAKFLPGNSSGFYNSQQSDYDYAIDFLLDEGYAQSVEEADALIEQLSDEEIYSILDEARFEDGRTRKEKVGIRRYRQDRHKFWDPYDGVRQADHKRERGKKNIHQFSDTDRLPNKYGDMMSLPPEDRRDITNFFISKMRRKPKTKLNLPESFDLYDIVLDHLINEGYADSEDSALNIMSCMSDEWAESIIEELKFIPLRPDQNARLDKAMFDAGDRLASVESSFSKALARRKRWKDRGVPDFLNPGHRQVVNLTKKLRSSDMWDPKRKRLRGLYNKKLFRRALDAQAHTLAHDNAKLIFSSNQLEQKAKDLEDDDVREIRKYRSSKNSIRPFRRNR